MNKLWCVCLYTGLPNFLFLPNGFWGSSSYSHRSGAYCLNSLRVLGQEGRRHPLWHALGCRSCVISWCPYGLLWWEGSFQYAADRSVVPRGWGQVPGHSGTQMSERVPICQNGTLVTDWAPLWGTRWAYWHPCREVPRGGGKVPEEKRAHQKGARISIKIIMDFRNTRYPII